LGWCSEGIICWVEQKRRTMQCVWQWCQRIL